MNFEITEYNFGERPLIDKLPDHGFLHAIGEEGMRELVNKHYNLLRKSEISHLFPKDDEGFEAAKKRSADFFIQICGGPDYFNQNRGKPILVRRHAPFKITLTGRKVWLNNYIKVLSDLDIDETLVKSFWDYINRFSIWMVNTEE